MKQLRYPGRFKREGRFIEVHLPGIGPFGTTTQGLDLDEARLMASDALTMKLQDIYGYRGTYPDVPDSVPSSHKRETWEWIYPSLEVRLAWRMRQMREARGWTQQEAAQRLGLSATTYTRWENPRTFNPTVKTLERLAELYGQPLVIAIGSDKEPAQISRRRTSSAPAATATA
ncbi:MAG: helix-turn-helix transcriptional regulator [Armatimonadetes bacterium]|nr:helix-turn-helix transcriptional regulator [Armatimonadota bacterium]